MPDVESNESSDSILTGGNCHKKDISKKWDTIAEWALNRCYCDVRVELKVPVAR